MIKFFTLKYVVRREIARHLARVALYDLRGKNSLYPPLKTRYESLQARMVELGKPIWLSEGFRDVERQNSLSRGVTNANELQSYHQYGLAFDVAFVKLNWNPPQDWWTILGEEGEKLGLTWGGRWDLRDYGHFEMHRNFTWHDLIDYFKI